MKKILKQKLNDLLPCIFVLTIHFLFQNTGEAFASSTTMPWETPLSTLQKSLTGPVAKGFLVITLAGLAGALILGEWGSTMKKILMIVIGGAMLVNASSFISTLFGDVDGLLIP